MLNFNQMAGEQVYARDVYGVLCIFCSTFARSLYARFVPFDFSLVGECEDWEVCVCARFFSIRCSQCAPHIKWFSIFFVRPFLLLWFRVFVGTDFSCFPFDFIGSLAPMRQYNGIAFKFQFMMPGACRHTLIQPLHRILPTCAGTFIGNVLCKNSALSLARSHSFLTHSACSRGCALLFHPIFDSMFLLSLLLFSPYWIRVNYAACDTSYWWYTAR